MIKKIIERLQGWVETDFRYCCDKLPQATQKKIVFILLGIFAFSAIYIFGYSIYQIGRNEGKKIVVEHLRLLPTELMQLNKETENNGNNRQ